jgi:hypothetical protein
VQGTVDHGNELERIRQLSELDASAIGSTKHHLKRDSWKPTERYGCARLPQAHQGCNLNLWQRCSARNQTAHQSDAVLPSRSSSLRLRKSCTGFHSLPQSLASKAMSTTTATCWLYSPRTDLRSSRLIDVKERGRSGMTVDC